MYTKGETVDPTIKKNINKKNGSRWIIGHVKFITYEAEEN